MFEIFLIIMIIGTLGYLGLGVYQMSQMYKSRQLLGKKMMALGYLEIARNVAMLAILFSLII